MTAEETETKSTEATAEKTPAGGPGADSVPGTAGMPGADSVPGTAGGPETPGLPEECRGLRRIGMEDPRIRVLGRTVSSRKPLHLYWTGSGIRLRAAASELWVEVAASFHQYEQWLTVVIDGAVISRQMLRRGRQWICLFRNADPGKPKTVQLVKDVQPMEQDVERRLEIHAVYTDGELLALPDPACRLEFVGDSVTSGEGGIGARCEMEWISEWFSATRNYAWLTAAALGADYQVISQSGWGVVCAWDNNPHGRVPDLYRKVCRPAGSVSDLAAGADADWDFRLFRPDAVVVNLGANDANAFSQPPFTDPVTGAQFQMQSRHDGTPEPDDLQRFEDAYLAFLGTVRECNPQAEILACQGIFGDLLTPRVQSAVRRFQEKTGDSRVHFLHLSEIRKEDIGAREHPGIRAHRRMASEIAAFLKTLPAFAKIPVQNPADGADSQL